MALDQSFGQNLPNQKAVLILKMCCGKWSNLQKTSSVWPYLSSANSHATVIELQLPQGVAAGALQQSFDSLHTIWTEGIVTQVQFSQPDSCAHQCITQTPLMTAKIMHVKSTEPDSCEHRSEDSHKKIGKISIY